MGMVISPYAFGVAGSADTWKLVWRNAAGGSFIAIQDIQWLDAGGSPISTSGATNTASAVQAGAIADMFDGNTGTFYQTAVVNDGFVQTVFTSPQVVKGVKIWPLSSVPSRSPAFFDVYQVIIGVDTYLFSGFYDSWVGGTPQTFTDPGAGVQPDWAVIISTGNGTFWGVAEIEITGTVGGADLTGGETAISSPHFAASGWAIGNLINNNNSDFAGNTFVPWRDWGGCRFASAIDAAEFKVRSRAGFNASQSITAGTIIAGTGNNFRRRKDFSGLTWPTDPTTNTITM